MPEAALLLEALAWWAGGILALLLGLEILARAGTGIALLSRENLIVSAWGGWKLAHDPLVGWRLREHHRTADGAFTTGPHGVRLTDSGLPPDEGGILVVGDSFTVCPGLADSETWPAHLERLLGRAVINGSCGGYGVDQIVLRAEQLAQQYRPSAIVLAVLDHDILRNGYAWFGSAKPWFVAEGDGLALQGVPVPEWGEACRRIDGLRRVVGYSSLLDLLFSRLGAKEWWLGTGQFARVQGTAASVTVSCRLMERVAALRDRLDVPVVVAMLYNAPTLAGDAPEWFAAPVLETARSEGLVTVDTFPDLHALYRDDGARFFSLWLPAPGRTLRAAPLDRLGYLSDVGSRTVAELVADALARAARRHDPTGARIRTNPSTTSA